MRHLPDNSASQDKDYRDEIRHCAKHRYYYRTWLDDQYQFNAQSRFLLSRMNGRTTDRQLRQAFRDRFGIELSDKVFRKFLRRLIRKKLIARRVSNRLLSKMQTRAIIDERKKFEKSRFRHPVFAGLMYPASRAALARQLRLCFGSVSDARLRRILKRKKRVRGLLVPHSNLELSGPSAAWAYKTLLMSALPEVVIILAPAHAGDLRYHFSVLKKSFRTALGVASVDKEFVRNLARRCDFNISAGSVMHWMEHSIEIQLLFLQYIFNRAKKRLKIVPIVCAYPYLSRSIPKDYWAKREKFLNALRSCINEYDERVLLVATGDLAHQDRHRPMRGFHAENQKLIRCLQAADRQLLDKYCIRGKFTTCGGRSFAAFLDLITPCKGVVLNYSWTSKTNIIKKIYGERGYSGFKQIGYASMVF